MISVSLVVLSAFALQIIKADPISPYDVAALQASVAASQLSSAGLDYKSILQHYPNYLLCDCDLSLYFDSAEQFELQTIATTYNLRLCDVQQWFLLVKANIPGLDFFSALNIVNDTAKAVRAEMDRRQLAYLVDYPDFCSTLYPASVPNLLRREPQGPISYIPSSVVPPLISQESYLPYYNSLMYLLEKALPNLTPQLQQDIIYAVYNNSPVPQIPYAQQLIQLLENNIRTMISGMIDFTPGYY